MKRRKQFKRFMTGSLAVILCVSMNINPLATLAGAIADSGFVDKMGNFKDHLVYWASVDENTVYAAGTGEETPGVDVTVNCDHSDEIDDLMGSGDITLTDINNSINNGFSTISGYVDGLEGYVDGLEQGQQDILNALGYSGTSTLAGDINDIKTSLSTIHDDLVGIKNAIQDQQHKYFVAHLYSLNNQMPNAMWRPYSEDVPYVEDFATVWGGFANVYTGYWDTAVTDITSNLWWRQSYESSNPDEFIYDYDRYAEVLGDDIIVIEEGIVAQTNVILNDMTGSAVGYSNSNFFAGDTEGKSPNTIVSLEQRTIDVDEVTWLDAVTVLYKAMGEELYSYQSFMSYNPSITPETSPAFQNLSNPVPNSSTDARPGGYNGYNVYFFTTRANPISPNQTREEGKDPVVDYIYWVKALKDGFIPSTGDYEELMNKPITAAEFWKLAEDIMTAYGEPTINDSEVRALLQVYGSEYPVQLGYQVADAWAYLKVRGCLECPMQAGDTVSRAQLLDVATRIKDEGFRADYKVITVTLDLADVMQDSGYYPVNDLTTTTDTFSATTTYDYTQFNYYSYIIGIDEESNLGTIGSYRVYKEQSRSDANEIKGSAVLDKVVGGKKVIEVRVPIDYTGNIYVAKTTFGDANKQPNGAVDFICFPSSGLGGGVFNKWNISDNLTTASTESEDIIPLSEYTAYVELIDANDYLRAGRDKPQATVASVDATVLDTLAFCWNEWTSPLVVKAAPVASEEPEPVVTVAIKGSGEISNPNSGLVYDGLSNILNTKMQNKISLSSIYGSSYTSEKIFENSDLSAMYYCIDEEDKLFMSLNRAALLLKVKSDIKSTFMGNSPETWINYYIAKTKGENWIEHAWSSMNSTQRNIVTGVGSDSPVISMQIQNSAGNGSEIVNYNMMQFCVLWKHGMIPSSSMTSDGTNASTIRMNNIIKCDGDITDASNYKSYFGRDIGSAEYSAAKEWIVTLNCSRISRNSAGYAIGTTMPEEVLAKFGKDEVGLGNTSSDGGQDTGTNTESRLDLPTTVSSDAIMRKDQQILLKWSDLVDCGYVIAEETGGLPELQNGALYFFTRHGQVKVNNTRHTIQIGTTLYDLALDDGTAPELYYFDNDQDELYIDYRCVLGVVKERISYDDEANTSVIDNASLGAGKAVVYNLGSATSSNQFTTKEVLTYNFPEIPNSTIGANNLGNINGYPIDVVMSTYYDTLETGNGTAVYWPEGTNNTGVRMAMSSFVPTANWMTVIDQDTEDDIEAYLFIWYPIEPFKNGYVDDVNGGLMTISENQSEKTAYYMNYKDDVTNANAAVNSKTSLKDALNTAYPGWEESSTWYIQMSCAAAAQLYEMTGMYYLSDDYVMRQVALTNTSVTKACNTFHPEQAENECLANSDGLMYWVPCIGYVYNIPSVSEFTLGKYFSGEYLLPLAVDINKQLTGQPNIINYNMPYYGYYPTYDGTNWSYTHKIHYGNALASDDIVNYHTLGKMGATLPMIGDGKGGDEVTPIQFSSFDNGEAQSSDNCYTPAPSGVYIYFGSSPLEQQALKGLTNWASYRNSIFYGTNQMMIESSETGSTNLNISLFGTKYADFAIPSTAITYRTCHTPTRDTLVVEPIGLMHTDLNGVVQVGAEDAPTNELLDFLDGLGSNDLISAIDNGASWLIVFAFQVLPWIGIILMTILVGLSFVSDTKIFRIICEKTVDPVRILTFGGRDIDHWHWKTVLFPCIILFTAFALFLNGNIIRIIMWGAEWYGIILKWFKTL